MANKEVKNEIIKWIAEEVRKEDIFRYTMFVNSYDNALDQNRKNSGVDSIGKWGSCSYIYVYKP